MALYIKVTYVNATKHYRFSVSPPERAFTDDKGELYRSCLKEFGRCEGKMFLEGKDGKDTHVGWVFGTRDKYVDCNETYMREVWVEVIDVKEEG